MINMKYRESYHGFVLLGSGILYLITEWEILLTLTAAASFMIMMLSEWPALWKLHRFGGYANWVTLLRLSGLFILFSLSGSLSFGQIVVFLIILLVLDGVDGFIARHFHHVSSFGAVFDMETDALFACFASVLLFEKDLTGEWILLIGFMRYIFVVIKYITGLNKMKEKRTRFGPTIAGILFIALIIPFVLKPVIYSPCLIAASILVSLSYAWSFYLLVVEKRRTPA